ncbi:MAG: flagellin lysine-N-methylase [Pseudomonadota bacterium]
MTLTSNSFDFLLKFKCTGGECPDTCCKSWNMQIDDKTINLYKEKAPDLLDSVTENSSNEYIMRRDTQTGFCVRFSDGLCGIQNKYGEDYLGDACNFYPRAIKKIGNDVVATATLSCPEIARLALFDKDAFNKKKMQIAKLPYSVKNYLPEQLSEVQANEIHNIFLNEALSETTSPEHKIMRMIVVCESLERISVSSWHDAVPFYFEHADSGIPNPERKESDQVLLLQSLCGLVFAAKKLGDNRLMQTIETIEEALHVTIRRDNLMIAALPDSVNAVINLIEKWNNSVKENFSEILSRYLAMQLSLAFFPFSGFGEKLTERITIIGIRFATIRLALASAYQKNGKMPDESEIIRIIQSLSRFMDHLGDAEFSLKIYEETGWLKKERFMGLIR